MMVAITECTLPVMCKDCTKVECGHHGKREADCPKYKCDRPDPWKRQCDTCAWLDKWYEEMGCPKKLTERERKVLRMRYCDGMTLVEIGQHFGVTRERIRQIEAKALRKMKGQKMTLADAMEEVKE